jgi:hypothetical protein
MSVLHSLNLFVNSVSCEFLLQLLLESWILGLNILLLFMCFYFSLIVNIVYMFWVLNVTKNSKNWKASFNFQQCLLIANCENSCLFKFRYAIVLLFDDTFYWTTYL